MHVEGASDIRNWLQEREEVKTKCLFFELRSLCQIIRCIHLLGLRKHYLQPVAALRGEERDGHEFESLRRPGLPQAGREVAHLPDQDAVVGGGGALQLGRQPVRMGEKISFV